MESTPDRQPLQEITPATHIQERAPSTPADAIVQRLMARIRELEHRLFDPDGILGQRLLSSKTLHISMGHDARVPPVHHHRDFRAPIFQDERPSSLQMTIYLPTQREIILQARERKEMASWPG